MSNRNLYQPTLYSFLKERSSTYEYVAILNVLNAKIIKRLDLHYHYRQTSLSW